MWMLKLKRSSRNAHSDGSPVLQDPLISQRLFFIWVGEVDMDVGKDCPCKELSKTVLSFPH